MRSLLASTLVGALLATGGIAVATATAAPASAATAKVVVKKIPTKTAPYGGKVTVKPVVSASGKVKVTSKTLTVKRASKTVATNKVSVKLVPGTYRVTTKVAFTTWTTKKSGAKTVKVWSAKKTKSLAQTLVVKQKARPSRTTPVSKNGCPSWAPVKGNRSSSGDWIYHVPGGRWYKATDPEECFTTAAAARAAGYRASKNG